MRKLSKRDLLRWGGWTAVAGLCGAVLLVGVVLFEVYLGDDSKLKRTTILARINQETSIYCHDEETLLGSFFADSRRRYVPISEMPQHMLNAMVAAEDKNFYNHMGIDPTAIASAFAEGVAAGGFRRGGSTITQQTVKNILDSWERSFTRKFREWIAAIQLERLYDKPQILEFYLNQFHVAGNGKGIGIAAQYYFSKNVSDLDLVESAFIAGSVKGPSKYNPYIKFTEEERKVARDEAFARKNYVLERMHEQGWISDQELKEGLKAQIPFNRGKFRIQEVSIVNMVRDDLNRKEILETLGVDDIAELDSAGLKIYSTIDCELQAEAQQKMRQNLSRLEIILKGFKPEEEAAFQKLRSLDIGSFYHAKIKKINPGKEPTIEMDLGYPQGIIPYEALKRMAMLLDLASGKGFEFHLKEILAAVKPGDILYTEVVSYDKETNLATLEMRKHPVIGGGMIALDKGEVRSVVTGFDTLGFNRALEAKRPPGSVFKPVVYFAALQLGWSILDRLENHRQVFTYQDQFYYPRPEHSSVYPDVSIIWAGVLSENLASVYLAAHLLDKLNFDQFRQLLDYMGLAPRADESAAQYHFRLAQALGVEINQEGIDRHQFAKAQQNIAANLMFEGRIETADEVSKMWWGRGYANELVKIHGNEDDHSPVELGRRIHLLKNNYQRLQRVGDRLVQDWDKLADELEDMKPQDAFRNSAYASMLKNFRVLAGAGGKPRLGFFPVFDEEETLSEEAMRNSKNAPKQKLTSKKFAGLPTPGRALNPRDLKAIWGRSGIFGQSTNIDVEDVILDGYLSLKEYKNLTEEFASLKQEVNETYDAHGLNRLFRHHDFRIALGLNYMTHMSRAMGVESPLEPILSFPLGTNDVSLAEVAKIYQTFATGELYRFYKEGPSNQITFIKRIDDAEGNTVYEPKRQSFRLVSDDIIQVNREILRRIVTHGTGSRAKSELYVSAKKNGKDFPIRVPAFGKTGSTNDFTTASFAGFIPYPTQKGAKLDPRDSYAISAYVGFDLNDRMVNGRIRVYGGTGALPLWTDFGRTIIDKKKYIDFVDPFDVEVLANREWQLNFSNELKNVMVDLPRGGIIGSSGAYSDDAFSATNLNKSGETYINEFALTAGVKANLYLPMQRSGIFGGSEPSRSVEFFKNPSESFMQNLEETQLKNARQPKLLKDAAKRAALGDRG